MTNNDLSKVVDIKTIFFEINNRAILIIKDVILVLHISLHFMLENIMIVGIPTYLVMGNGC